MDGLMSSLSWSQQLRKGPVERGQGHQGSRTAPEAATVTMVALYMVEGLLGHITSV